MNRKAVNRFIIGLSAFMLCACSSLAGPAPGAKDGHGESTWKQLERGTLKYAYVTWENVSAPFKHYLLIKDGQFLCAVKFTDYWRGGDAHPGTVWSSGEETLLSKYEWNVLAVAGDKVKATSHGGGMARFTAPWGFGHLIFGGGYDNIKCGSREYNWMYPGAVIFTKSPEMKLAPTRWANIDDIRLDDPKLAWYQLDENREQIDIPLSDL